MTFLCQISNKSLISFAIKIFISSPLLILLVSATCCIVNAASALEIDGNGNQRQSSYHLQRQSTQQRQQPRTVKATFVNDLPETHINLYWAGNYRSTKYPPGVLQLFYGPIPPNGGELTIEGYENQIFVLTESGSYNRVGGIGWADL